jgi:biotin transport system substrate-specific component
MQGFVFAMRPSHGRFRACDLRSLLETPMPPLTSPTSLSLRPSSSGVLRALVQVIGGSLVMALAAHVAVPFWPVPLTLQTLAMLGLGAALGPAVGGAAILAWILDGLAGLPVFAAGAGPAVLLGPTGGYVVGFLPAVMLAGLAARRGWLARPITAVLAFVAADAVVFAFGVGWLATLVGFDRAIAGGFTPFLLGEILKIGLAAAGTVLVGRTTRA